MEWIEKATAILITILFGVMLGYAWRMHHEMKFEARKNDIQKEFVIQRWCSETEKYIMSHTKGGNNGNNVK